MPGIILWRGAARRMQMGATRGGMFGTYEPPTGPTVNGIYFGKRFFGAHAFGPHYYG